MRREGRSIDNERLLPHLRAEPVDASRVERVLHEAEALVVAVSAVASAGGDTRALRGIPALARGVGGVMAGTQPEQALMDGA